MAITLDAPDQARPGTATYEIQTIVLEWGEPDGKNAYIQVSLKGENDIQHTLRWSDEEGAQAMILALNTANLSTRSLRKRIFDKAVADGKLAGIVA